MEATFITIHDLSPEARILYSSDSIVDILGHTPDEVVGKPCWNFFHPDEIPFAKQLHGKGVELEKAAVLAYCQIRHRHGQWIGCECCFSIVYDVMVCCTSIYHRGIASQKRAVEAPIVRKLFTSSPKDPRYHMLTHLSNKFRQAIQNPEDREPRAALFLNRFTRTLTIMYATSGIENIIGINANDMKGRSFYFCIQENCLEDAVRCLESAKGNDSIAYLRFWYRDPRQDDHADNESSPTDTSTDEEMTDVSQSDADTESGSPHLGRSTDPSRSHNGDTSNSHSYYPGDSSTQHSPTLSRASGASRFSGSGHVTPGMEQEAGVELEAVVSCTSDGLVVCLRRARPVMPPSAQPQVPRETFPGGLFAAPWAAEPLFVPALQQQPVYPFGATAPGGQHYMGQVAEGHARGGPSQQAFMNSIRDQAVFAWALTGINGSLAEYSRGTPKGDSQPPDGLPVWQPDGPGGIMPALTPGSGGSGYGSGSGNGSGSGSGNGNGHK